MADVYELPLRVHRRSVSPADAVLTEKVLLTDEHGYVLSTHPNIASACVEARRIHGYRLAHDMPAIATRIEPHRRPR